METAISLTVLFLPLLARGLAEAAQRRSRRRPWDDITAGEPEDPFRGHKIAQLILGADGRAWLAGVTSIRYGVDTLATCRRRGCRPPGTDCRCGFYAFRRRGDAVALLERLRDQHPARSYVLLTVDLDGDVLEYELGYRAQRQRVLRVEVPAHCEPCRRRGRTSPATGYVAHPQFRGEQLLHERTLLARTALPPGSAPIRALCPRHQPRDEHTTAHRLDVPELRGRLATEVVAVG